MRCLAYIAVAGIAHSAAHAEPQVRGVYASAVDTTELATSCRGTGLADENFCNGYILASFDALSMTRQICGRPGVTTAMTTSIARKYLDEHPSSWDKSPAYLVKVAFQAAFPCN